MTNLLSIVLLQVNNANASYLNFLVIGAMILVFYLFMIRPQAKKAKLAKKFQEEMQKGDKIVTIAGIHGKVNKVNDDGTIDMETSPGSYLRIEKSAISIEWTQNANKATTALADKK
ncbi:MAG TPA: preprotein translocase subunit YajC [Puia sp.]|nr:preprotein translocase subunit YajC [Puia sp.]